MAYRKVPGIDWFIHPLVAGELLRDDKVRSSKLGRGNLGTLIGTLHSNLGVLMICDDVPVIFAAGSKTYYGGWSQTLDEQHPLYVRCVT